MPGGLLQLVAYGAQDVYLTGNPQITFFKVVYRRHTNFAIESIEQTFNGSTNIGSTSVNVQITRNGDLINRIYFKGKIKNHGIDSAALVPYYGLRLIKNVLLQIGSQTIDKHYSEWMYIWNELSMPMGKREGYHKMVGGNKRNSSTKIGPNDEKIIYVPLEFWFCRNVGLALPLIALQYHEVKISMEFCTLNELLDNNANNYCYDVITGDKVDGDDNANDSYISRNIVLEDAEMWVDYIFLDTDERRRFAQLSHEYLIEQLQFTGSEKITQGGSETMRSVKINFNHPCKELFWVIKPDQDGTYKPYWNNFTNKARNELYNQLEDVDDVLSSGSVNIDNPVTLARIQLNGADRFSERPGNYFSVIQPYQHHENTPGLYNMGINVYSFALKPEEHQPSGTLNMSRIDTAHLQVASSVTGMISVFAINYNVLRILSGMGGLAYSN